MDYKGYRHIPRALFDAITFLAQALPKRSVPTFLELLFGAMLTQTGFVTDAVLAVNTVRHWNSYYKWLHFGKWSWVALGCQTARLALQMFPRRRWFLMIDDTIVFRSSKKAPGSAIHHQHGNKTNRPTYVRGQCWVTLALTLSKGFRSLGIPILSRLARQGGNSGKLVAAKTMLRVIAPLFKGFQTSLLMDSWYMRCTLISYALEHGLQVIGQVRRDTALFHQPVQTGKRGRPRKYGDKVSVEWIDSLPEVSMECLIYGKTQMVYYRSAVVLARFLNGRAVRIVWSQLINDNGVRTKPSLILSTDTSLSAARVILSYGRRWSVEDLFNQLKNRWGWKETWQQTRQVLHRWVQILSVSYAIPQLLVLLDDAKVKTLASLSPWRLKQPITAGRVRQGLQRFFGHVNIRAMWNPKSGKFGPQKWPVEDDYHPKWDEAA
jgi:DDE superfamily endonuclease